MFQIVIASRAELDVAIYKCGLLRHFVPRNDPELSSFWTDPSRSRAAGGAIESTVLIYSFRFYRPFAHAHGLQNDH